MPDSHNQSKPGLITSRAHGVMIDHSASKVQVRDLQPAIADEKPSGGGKNRGPSPLEYVLIGLCA